MDYVLATHNLKKRDELHRILSPLGINVHIAEELGLELTDVEETGTTFEENALLKARSGCEETGYPCIADDSGLSVDYLDGAPGVFSARYSGGHGNDEENNKKVLRELEGVPFEKRGAAFISAVCVVYPDGTIITARGECRGRIGFEPVGEGGFGYDPLFMAEKYDYKLSTAQLTAQQKDEISHRGAALRELAATIVNK